MEKKLGVVFTTTTTIVTHINNTTTLSFFSNPNSTSLKNIPFSLYNTHGFLYLFIHHHPVIYFPPSIIITPGSGSLFSSLRSSFSRSSDCSRRDIVVGHNVRAFFPP